MAQQPFFTSQTPTARMDTRLAGSAGANLGAGLQQAAQAFAGGIEAGRAKKEKKLREEAAVKFAVKQYGLSEEDAKNAVAAVGAEDSMQLFQAAEYQKAIMKQMGEKERSQQAALKAFDETAKGAFMATEDGSPGEFDPESFDFKKFALKAAKYGASEQDVSKFAQAILPEGGAVDFITDPETKGRFAVRGNTMLQIGGKEKATGHKDGDKVMLQSLGREIIWNGSLNQSFDAKTGEPLYFAEGDFVTGNKRYVKNPAVWGEKEAPMVEIPEGLFGNVNF